MRKTLGVVLSLIVVFSVVAMAADKSLSDQQLSAITAGNYYGSASGAIAAGGGENNVTETTAVYAKSGLQQDAKGMNIANTAGGMLANGVNVWSDRSDLHGTLISDAELGVLIGKGFGGGFLEVGFGMDMKQVNIISQTAAKSSGAKLEKYFSSGSLAIDNLNLKVKDSYSYANFGSISKDYFSVSNTFDQFTGLGVDLDKLYIHHDKVVAEGDLCVLCNTYDKFKLTKSSFDARWAEFEKNKFYLSLAADSVDYRGPIYLRDASAEYIAVDDGTNNINVKNIVSLGCNAQSGASAMNIVNAANSLVANAVNVASGDAFRVNTFKQVNVITQK